MKKVYEQKRRYSKETELKEVRGEDLIFFFKKSKGTTQTDTTYFNRYGSREDIQILKLIERYFKGRTEVAGQFYSKLKELRVLHPTRPSVNNFLIFLWRSLE